MIDFETGRIPSKSDYDPISNRTRENLITNDGGDAREEREERS
jgi:hypothetical protein